MKKNIKNNISQTKFLSKIVICLALLFAVFLTMDPFYISFAKEENEFCYLSDIKYRSDSSVGWGNITLDRNLDSNVNKGQIALIVNGEKKQFFKGISAHATSTLIYDITNYNYDYFTAYIGVDQGRGNNGNGVKFSIYTSVDGENWNLKTPASPRVMKGNTEAEFVKIDIKDANYLKLYAHNNGNATADHAVYADAKLIKEGYEESEGAKVDFIKTVEEYEQIIKNHQGEEITGEYELALLQREFVSNAGYDYLQFFAGYKDSYRKTLEWLMTDLENMRLYVLGGRPDGDNYPSSLTILSKLYEEYSSDFTNTELLNNPTTPNMTYGYLYKKMAMSIALTHSQTVGLWMNSSSEVNKSEPLRRYAIFKYLHKNGGMRIAASMDMTHMFEDLHVQEMRLVLYNNIDDEEILWLNRYTQDNIDANPNNVWRYQTPHPYIAYVWPNYANPVYYDPANTNYFNELFAVKKTDNNKGTELVNSEGQKTGKIGIFDSEFVIPGGKNIPEYRIKVSKSVAGQPNIYKVWMNFRNKFGTGCVCGGISKSGANIRGVHGIPAMVVGQPGHAALMFYSKDDQGRGYWRIDNDVSGWTLSGGGGRLLRWGSSNTDGYSNGVYVELEQAAINDYENLMKAEKLVMLAKLYANDPVKQEELYRKALKIQSINFDAWIGLIDSYKANEAKTEDDFYNLAEEVAENLKYFPLPMYNATNLIKPKLTSVGGVYKFTLLQDRTLNAAKNLPNNTTTSFTVMQPGVTRVEAGYLLGQLDRSIANFSFDGEDANKIVLASRFDGNGVRWDYCIDGNPTDEKNAKGELIHWKEISFDANEEHKWLLTPEEVASITAENDIYVHIVGVNYDEKNLYKIDIQDSSGLPATLYANDLENKLIASVPEMEWRLNKTDSWTLYKDAQPDLTGNKRLFVRMAATGTHLEGDTVEYQFTQDEVNDKRQYIPITHLEIAGFSTESQDNKRPFYAPNTIDGNLHTLWHTDFGQNVLQQSTKPFISIKLDEPKNIAALEFIQTKYPGRPQDPDDIKNARVYVSVDGETWAPAGQIENCDTYGDLYAINFEKPVYGQYVKIELDTKNMFASLAMVNLYEDTTVVTLGTFSFDGENAGKIMLLDEFKNTNWEYSLDGGSTWKAGVRDEQQLTVEELKQINVEDKIKLRLNNMECIIDIEKQDAPVITAYLNDLENRLIGIGDISKFEWRTENGSKNWISYSEQEAIVTGDTKLFIRKKATSTLLASDAVEFTFTEDNQPDTAKYVSIKNIVNVTVSNTTVPSRGEEGIYAVDGLPTTMWHSNRTTTTMHDPRWIVLELDEPRYISKIEYVRKAGYAYGIPRDGVVSVSMDGENWTEVLNFQNLYNVATPTELIASDDRKELELSKLEKAKYIKIECTKSCDSVHGNRDGKPMDYFFSAAMFNLYEDTTKVDVPTAEIEYSTRKLTNQDVTAKLVNKSTEITVTNNGGKDTYTFTQNGNFTFEFVDKKGTKGTATAKVDWIDKNLPTASITYSTENLTNQDVTATVTFDKENVTVEGGNTHLFTENGTYEFKFVGPAGNTGTAVAKVDWIDKKEPKPTIKYSSTNLSNKDVIATITFDEENVTVKGGNTHIFAENGEFTFEFEDAAGNTGTAVAKVTWIDKTLPEATITYSTTNLTNEDVTATVTFNKNGVLVEGGDEYVFTENGTHEFRFVGPAGNVGVAVATVDWIDKVAPVGTIEYSTTDLTNESVTATITFNEDDVRMTNNDGKNTYTFEINGEFEFEFEDAAGNKGTATADVGWIDKREINATITYDINDITNQDVTATITFDKQNVTILNNDGKNTYVFTENGTFEFSFIGPAGNRGTAVAEVTWIDKIPPVATVNYSTKESTTGPVTATVTFNEGGITMTNEQGEPIEDGDTHTFTENGTHTFYYVGPLGNKGKAVAEVTWIKSTEPEDPDVPVDPENPDEPIIDTVVPTARVEYSTQDSTTEPVIATLVDESEEIRITNNGGKRVYTFTKNGEFTFEFVDKAGNKGTATAKVSWIEEEPENPDEPIVDTVAPTARVEYSTQDPTTKPVIATLVDESEEIRITNNGGKRVYTFTKNGEFTFEFVDKAGNKGTAIAKVDWIKEGTTINAQTGNNTNSSNNVINDKISNTNTVEKNQSNQTKNDEDKGTDTMQITSDQNKKGYAQKQNDTNQTVSTSPKTLPDTGDKNLVLLIIVGIMVLVVLICCIKIAKM